MSTLKLDSLRHEDCHTALKVSIIVDESCKNVCVTNSINIFFWYAYNGKVIKSTTRYWKYNEFVFDVSTGFIIISGLFTFSIILFVG